MLVQDCLLGSMKLIPLSPQKETHDFLVVGFLFGAMTQASSALKEWNQIKTTASSFSDDAWVSMLVQDCSLGSITIERFLSLSFCIQLIQIIF